MNLRKENEGLVWAMLSEVLKHQTLPHSHDQAAEAWKLAWRWDAIMDTAEKILYKFISAEVKKKQNRHLLTYEHKNVTHRVLDSI